MDHNSPQPYRPSTLKGFPQLFDFLGRGFGILFIDVLAGVPVVLHLVVTLGVLGNATSGGGNSPSQTLN